MTHKISIKFANLLLALIISFAVLGSALAAAGSLDASFGTGGIVTTDFNQRGDFGYAVALQPDGKIIVAGTSSDYSGSCCNHDFALARYKSDGSPDSSFDADGMVITGFGSSAFGNTHESGSAVTIQPDGKIVVAGASTTFNSRGGDSDFALARYNNDGSLDTTFDTDGKVTTDLGTIYDNAFSVAIQPDGKIVASGGSYLKLAMVRYNSDGSLDTTFDTDGKVILDFGSGENYGGMLALQPDGKIVLAGQTFVFQVGYVFAVARYNSDGSLDTTFDTDGKVTTDFENSFDDGISAVVVQADGKIIVAGIKGDPGGLFALARYNSDGSLDTSFDNDGKVTTVFGSSEDGIFDIAIQLDGRIVAAGRTRNGSTADFALARYNSSGLLDTTFDSDGKVTTAIGSAEDYGYAVVLQSDNKIVVAGSSNLLGGNDYDFALARYDAAASGVVTVSVPGTANPWLAGMPDGTLSHFGDSAPANSPTQIPGLSITPGELLSFSATGLISHGPPSDPLIETSGPEGGTNILAHDFGPENGISDVQAPINALMGVFLGPNQPDLSPTLDALDFSTAASRDYLSLSPQLHQAFFIGDGLTTKGQVQQIVIPAGATRLFVGPMDASQYINNEGFFTVQVYASSAVVVTVDVKPGRFPNRIELDNKVCKGDDNLYVAILTSPGFNAQTLNVSSLQLGDPLLDRTVSPVRSRIRDVDLDGDQDLALTFSLCKLVRNKALNASSTELVLTGSTSDGLTITGRDSVKVVR